MKARTTRRIIRLPPVYNLRSSVASSYPYNGSGLRNMKRPEISAGIEYSTVTCHEHDWWWHDPYYIQIHSTPNSIIDVICVRTYQYIPVSPPSFSQSQFSHRNIPVLLTTAVQMRSESDNRAPPIGLPCFDYCHKWLHVNAHLLPSWSESKRLHLGSWTLCIYIEICQDRIYTMTERYKVRWCGP